jgi:hypothetical protein
VSGSDWLDGAIRIDSSAGGGLVGGPPRWVWHTYEADPAGLSAVEGARSLHAAGNDVHFVLNPLTGDIAQLLPASVSGRGLKNSQGGVETNRLGTVCLQVEVIAFASHPFTGIVTPAGKEGLGRLIRFGRAHGIPDVWPAGPPPAYPHGFSVRSAATWTAHPGHYGHSQVPENDHGDPGAIDVQALFATARSTSSLSKGHRVFVIRTPSNGSFAVWPDGDHMAYVKVDDATAARWVAGGIPQASLGAADATALMRLQAAVQDPDAAPAVVDVTALAQELVPLLPQGTSLTAEHIADVMASRLAQ